MKPVVIIGGGVTGLSTGWKLSEKGYKVYVIEKREKVGGISGSFQYKDFTLDLGPHKLHSRIPNIMDEIKGLLEDELITIPKKSNIFLRGKLLNYPVGMKELFFGLNPFLSIQAALSYFQTLVQNMIYPKEDITYEDWIQSRFGRKAYELIFEQLATKVYGDPKYISADLARTRIAITSLWHLLKNTLFGGKFKKEISVENFYYPKKGIQRLSDRMGEMIKKNDGEILLESKPSKINLEGNKIKGLEIESKDGKSVIETDCICSSMPISNIVNLFENVPSDVTKSAKNLKYRSLILTYIVLNKKKALDTNWIFVPEKDIFVNRISEQKSFSEEMGPKDKTVVIGERTCEYGDEMWNLQDEEIFKRVKESFLDMKLIKEEEIIEYFIVRLKRCYICYDINYNENRENLFRFCKGIENFYLVGQFGLFNYSNMDNCIDMGIKLADFIESKNDVKIWYDNIVKQFKKYIIVD